MSFLPGPHVPPPDRAHHETTPHERVISARPAPPLPVHRQAPGATPGQTPAGAPTPAGAGATSRATAGPIPGPAGPPRPRRHPGSTLPGIAVAYVIPERETWVRQRRLGDPLGWD
ncbi:hypothetical protein [Conexibacter sp. DBS9H8]|uniref:hypothetical protein n=1 Tax=Conexibacter sp. DBS9H8 TaxID=2937801 RepID=UPI00200D797F|nr:hypothetical protein [Conexibacter sp. DBS9H8]